MKISDGRRGRLTARAECDPITERPLNSERNYVPAFSVSAFLDADLACPGGQCAAAATLPAFLSADAGTRIMGVLAKVFTANVDFSRSPGHAFNAKGRFIAVSAGAPSRDEAGNGERKTCRRQQLPLFPLSRSTVPRQKMRGRRGRRGCADIRATRRRYVASDLAVLLFSEMSRTRWFPARDRGAPSPRNAIRCRLPAFPHAFVASCHPPVRGKGSGARGGIERSGDSTDGKTSASTNHGAIKVRNPRRFAIGDCELSDARLPAENSSLFPTISPGIPEIESRKS